MATTIPGYNYNPMSKKERIERLEMDVEYLLKARVSEDKARQECQTCGGLFLKEKMKRVELIISFSNGMYDDGESFFCKGCVPAYDKVFVKRVSPLPSERDEHRYYKTKGEIEVDKNGRKIK